MTVLGSEALALQVGLLLLQYRPFPGDLPWSSVTDVCFSPGHARHSLSPSSWIYAGTLSERSVAWLSGVFEGRCSDLMAWDEDTLVTRLGSSEWGLWG